MTDQHDDAVAATVVLLRDAPSGVEVLLLERPHDRGSFAGAWVFPGGAVEDADVAAVNAARDSAEAPHPAAASAAQDTSDAAELGAATIAAARETREETGLIVAERDLVATACWVPPQGVAKRLRTWFFVAPAPDAPIVLSPNEAVDHAWLRPEAALERHASRQLRLYPPTWVTLHGLTGLESVADAVRRAREGSVQRFASRFAADRRTIYWQPDVAYGDETDADAPGARHRLLMHSLPWSYQFDPH